MSNLVEIQEAIEKLAPKERAELWHWFQAQEVEETEEMLAPVEEEIRSIEVRGGTPAEDVRKLISKWITKVISHQPGHSSSTFFTVPTRNAENQIYA